MNVGYNRIGKAQVLNLVSIFKQQDQMKSVGFAGCDLGVDEAKAVADYVSVSGGLTVIDLLYNKLDVEAAKMLAEVAKQKGISLCGIQRDQTTADFRKRLQPSEAILLASDLSQAVVTGALTSVELGGNELKNRGWGAIFAAICGNKDSKIMSMDVSGENIDPAGVKLIAKALRTSVSGALTSLDLSNNALCGLVQGTVSGTYSAEGITAIAEALRIIGSLTSVKLSGNKLKDRGWGAIFAAICGNKDSKIMFLDASKEKIGPAGVKLIAEALRTNVTGSLTQVLAF